MTQLQKISIAAAAIVVAGAAGAFFLWPESISPNGQEAPVLTPRVDRGIEPKDEEMIRGKITKLEADYQAEVAKGENGITILLQIGNWYYTLGELDTAISYYDRILKDFPNDTPAFENKGQALIEMGDYAGAETNWRKAISISADEVTYLRLADLITVHFPNRISEVRLLLEEGVATVGQTEGFMVALGNWYKSQGMLEEAISHYEVAVALNPKNTTIINLIQDLRKQLVNARKNEAQGK